MGFRVHYLSSSQIASCLNKVCTKVQSLSPLIDWIVTGSMNIDFLASKQLRLQTPCR